jgi:hypothetical protein
MHSRLRHAAILLAAFLFLPFAAIAANTEVLFDTQDRFKTIFPSNFFTDLDLRQNTSQRVSLPLPDCTINQVRCDDVATLNTLDGFNLQPRISIPFSGPINVSTVDTNSVFLISLGSTRGGGSVGELIGINQVVMDPATNMLHVETDEFLEQHTRYAVIVTDRVKDAAGDPIQDRNFTRMMNGNLLGQILSSILNQIREGVLQALVHVRRIHGNSIKVVGATVFTTMSVTSDLEKIQKRIQTSAATPVNFNVVDGGQRAVFPVNTLTTLTWNTQQTVGPVLTPIPLPNLLGLQVLGPNVVSTLAFAKFNSPSYLRPDITFTPVASRSGTPVVQGTNEVHVNFALPAGPKPAAGYPVAIFGHGFANHKLGGFLFVSASMAQQGIATAGINVVGHGFGPASTYTFGTSTGPVTLSAGGRGVDTDGNGLIGPTEGVVAPLTKLIGNADGLRQTAIDLMQLVRQIQAGVDIDGDGTRDLDPGRIYYFGQSFGGIYGTIFSAIEPAVRAAVPNVGGGADIDILRLSAVFRPIFAGPVVAVRGLNNLPTVLVPPNPQIPTGQIFRFDENLPLRNEPPRINNVVGANALQDFIDQSEWGTTRGGGVSYAPYLRKVPLSGNRVKPVIVQYGRGDQTVPNPTQTALARAGELESRVTYYRHDLTVANNILAFPTIARDPHLLLTNITAIQSPVPDVRTAARQAQAQIATFFATDGAQTIDPDGAGLIFETPIAPPLPETLNFIP